jgi:hypothetical protein
VIRRDREVTDFREIVEMLDGFDVVRIGIGGDQFPYVVPLSFGYEIIDGKIVIYFHGAKIGKKVDLLEKSKKVCVEADEFIRYDEQNVGITTRYKSIIGYGEVEELTADEDKVRSLNATCVHCGYTKYDSSICKSLKHTRCFKIILDEITGKKNLRNVDI